MWEGLNELVRITDWDKFYVVEFFPRALSLTIWDISEFHFPDYLLADLDKSKGIVVAKSDMDLWEELTTHHLTRQGFSWVGREVEVAGLFRVVLIVHSQSRDYRAGDWFIPSWQEELDPSSISLTGVLFPDEVFTFSPYEISLLPFEKSSVPKKITICKQEKHVKHLLKSSLEEVKEVRKSLSKEDPRYAWVRMVELTKELHKKLREEVGLNDERSGGNKGA